MLRPVLAAVLLPLMVPAPTHGAGQATSNYRTDETTVSPAVAGLTVAYRDSDSSVLLTWTGSGEVVVFGYANEPFLRINSSGVERNERSPATYLNQDRYARVKLPPQADSQAAPVWTRLSSVPTTRWHDHRTHWMDPTPPAQVRANPDRVTVVFPAWSIPITVNGAPVSIAGRLLWIPPPPKTPWVILGVGLLVLFGVVVAFGRAGRAWPTLTIAAVATTLFGMDSVGYYVVATNAPSGRSLYLVWPAVLIGALVVAGIRARRPGQGVIGLACTGAILAAVGGYDRMDAVTHSQVFARLPSWLTRFDAVTCLAAGVAILAASILRIFAAPTSAHNGRRPAATPSTG